MIVSCAFVSPQGLAVQISPSRMHHTEAERILICRMTDDSKQRAGLRRMVMQNHMCPFGLKTLDRLKRDKYEDGDHPLKSRDEVAQFVVRNCVKTTRKLRV